MTVSEAGSKVRRLERENAREREREEGCREGESEMGGLYGDEREKTKERLTEERERNGVVRWTLEDLKS